ncbi:MAG: transaldolase family protein [Candidatus Hydrogenedentota bacterium]
MSVTHTLDEAVCRFLEEAHSRIDDAPVTLNPDPEWQKLGETGTELWLDTGDIDAAREHLTAEFTALTTNNTLLNKEVQKGIYDDFVVEAARAVRAAAPGINEQELALEIAFILNAHHAQRLVHIFGRNVSVELHTDLADNVDGSVAYGERYHRIDPEHFIVKVPLTPAGFFAARKLQQQNIRVNFTLGFSARQNYLAAVLAQPNYVNVFMGRLGAFVADNGLGEAENVGEKATLATQRVVSALRETGRTESLLIGASMRRGNQVPALAGVDVYTMPPKVAAEYRQAPLAAVPPQVQIDPQVTLAEGVNLDDFAGGSLWDVRVDFVAAIDQLLKKEVDGLGPEDLQDHFTTFDVSDLLPRWSEDDKRISREEGKIPKLDTWKNRLAKGEIGLDALMNLAALQSFTADQMALDARVRGLVG